MCETHLDDDFIWQLLNTTINTGQHIAAFPIGLIVVLLNKGSLKVKLYPLHSFSWHIYLATLRPNWNEVRWPLGYLSSPACSPRPSPYIICYSLINQPVELGCNDGLDLSHDISKWPHPLPRIMAAWKASNHGIWRWERSWPSEHRTANKAPVLANATRYWHTLTKVLHTVRDFLQHLLHLLQSTARFLQ